MTHFYFATTCPSKPIPKTTIFPLPVTSFSSQRKLLSVGQMLHTYMLQERTSERSSSFCSESIDDSQIHLSQWWVRFKLLNSKIVHGPKPNSASSIFEKKIEIDAGASIRECGTYRKRSIALLKCAARILVSRSVLIFAIENTMFIN